MRLLDLGVFVEKKSEMPNIFFLGLLPLSFCLFSSLSQPFSFMIQKSLVNIPARQLYWASQRPPLCTELSGSQHSFCNAQLFTHWSSPQNHLFWLLYYLFSKKMWLIITIKNHTKRPKELYTWWFPLACTSKLNHMLWYCVSAERFQPQQHVCY